MQKSQLLLAVFLLILSLACTQKSADGVPETVSFNFHVRPILSDKCFACHGPDEKKREAGLRLDLRDSALVVIVPGKPEESELFRRIASSDPDFQMPQPDAHLGQLTEAEILIFKKWIEQGAKYEKHWAFVAPQKADLPKISGKKWARNEIDFFVREKMEQHDLQPSAEAEPHFLLKRLQIDLAGLPPSLAEMEDFEKNFSDSEFEKKVDALLAAPSFGEKMSVFWLDIARFSDSYGYQDDNLRTQWPYRDWVIHAFNQNLPYDKFITWQLAGDLLDGATKEQILATAFLRNHKYTEEGGVIPEEYRVEYHVDKVKTYSKGLLGLTAECAQCHDHKYDPISQRDYFQLFGFFNQSKEQGFEGDVSVSKPAKTPVLTISDADTRSILNFLNKKDTGAVAVSVMADTLRPTFVLKRGAYDQPTARVLPSALAAVLPFDTVVFPRNRLGLARWTVSRDHPLTARVFVNHLWQEFFGSGLVKTSGDFGMQGSLPSHPELLDWLAADFMENGWDIKRLVKKIVLSTTYRQSAKTTAALLAADPENRWLARAPRFRMKAEFVRDWILATSGLLCHEIGGASVMPYQPAGLWENSTSGRGILKKYDQSHDSSLYRRGLYTFVKLTLPPPAMTMFDASNRDQCEVKRPRTNTPLQALIMLNDPTVLEAARVFAQKILEKNLPADAALAQIFQTITCRRPSKTELLILKKYHAEQFQNFQNQKLDARQTLAVGEFPVNKNLDAAASAALMKVVAMVFNLEEVLVKC